MVCDSSVDKMFCKYGKFVRKMKKLWKIKVSQALLVLLFCLLFLVGIELAHSGVRIDSSWWWLALLGSAFTLRKKTVVTALFIVLFGLGLGWWRGGLYMQKLGEYNHYYYQKVTITGQAMDDSAYGSHMQQTFDTHNVVVESTGQQLTGKVKVSGLGFPAAYTGNDFVATGKLAYCKGLECSVG